MVTNMLGGYVQDISHISLSANWMSASGHFGEDAKLFEAVKESATGTCHGPTNWSRATMPVTLLSPIVMRKFLLAMLGSCNILSIASSSSIALVSKALRLIACVVALIVVVGGLPSNISIGM
jgi:hypothetical protein